MPRLCIPGVARGAMIAALILAYSMTSRAADIATSYGVPGLSQRLPSTVTLCPSADGSNTAVACASGAAIGPAVPPFTATTADQPLTLTLPGKFRIENPQYLIGTATLSTTPLQINYAGGNACTAPTATLSPGQIDDWLFVAGTTQPHVCAPVGTVQIEVQQ